MFLLQGFEALCTYDHSSAKVTKRRARPERAHHRMSVYIFVDITSHIAGFGCRMTAMICPLYLLCYLFPYSSRIFQTNIPEALVFRANFSQSFHILFPSSWLVTFWRQSMFMQQTVWWLSLQRRELLACLAWSHRHGLLSGHFCILSLSFSIFIQVPQNQFPTLASSQQWSPADCSEFVTDNWWQVYIHEGLRSNMARRPHGGKPDWICIALDPTARRSLKHHAALSMALHRQMVTQFAQWTAICTCYILLLLQSFAQAW